MRTLVGHSNKRTCAKLHVSATKRIKVQIIILLIIMSISTCVILVDMLGVQHTKAIVNASSLRAKRRIKVCRMATQNA